MILQSRGPASVFTRRPARAPATRISPARCSAPALPRSGGTLPLPSRTASAAPREGARRPKPPCAGFSTASGTCPRRWKCSAPAPVSSIRSTAWINAQGRQDGKLVGMGCTFTALVLRGRLAHVLHVGDTRAYRLSAGRLLRLTTDHVRDDRGSSPVLTRALGIEPELRLDYTSHPVALHDRFLLCTDGVHGALVDEAISRHPARTVGARGYQQGNWSRRRSRPAAPTTAPLWCWMWSRCRRRAPPMSVPPSCACR